MAEGRHTEESMYGLLREHDAAPMHVFSIVTGVEWVPKLESPPREPSNQEEAVSSAAPEGSTE